MSTSTWHGTNGSWTDASQWTGPVPDGATADAVFSAPGSYAASVDSATSIAARDVTLNASGATLLVEGTLDLSGTLSLMAGTLELAHGILSDATVQASGGATFAAIGGTLDHVTWNGTLALSAAATFDVIGGLDVRGLDGTSPGTITADGSTIVFEDSETFDDVQITHGALSIGVRAGHTLTLGTHFSSIGTSSNDGFALSNGNGRSSGRIVNAGSIADRAVFVGIALTNDGSISTPQFRTFAAMTNAAGGTIQLRSQSVGGDDDNVINATFSNAGRIIGVNQRTDLFGDDTMSIGATFTNQASGSIDLTNYAFLAKGRFVNHGTISIGAGAALTIAGSMVNDGTIAVSNGGSITLGLNHADKGAMTITDSTLIINGTFSTSYVRRFFGQGDTVGIATQVALAGRTLVVSAATIKGELEDGGTIAGGTIEDSDDASWAVKGGTLDGVTIDGAVAFLPASQSPIRTVQSQVTITDGLTLRSADGSGTGRASLTDARLAFDGTQTLDNAALACGPLAEIDAVDGTLTLGAGTTIATTQSAFPLILAAIEPGSALINRGVITGTVLLDGDGSVTNSGTIEAASGLSTIRAASFTNLSGGILTGGTYAVDDSATLAIVEQQRLVVDAAVITLSGPGASFDSVVGNTSFALQNTLTTVASGGSLNLVNGGRFAGTAAFVDDGAVTLGGATFAERTLTIDAGGSLAGQGRVEAGPMTNDGRVSASGGVLTLAAAVSGAGRFDAAAGATLDFTGAVRGGTVTLAGDATLALDAPLRFHATLADVGPGETIDLKATTATGLVYVTASDRLFVRDGATTLAAIQLQGTFAAAGFHLARSGGDSLITYVAPAITG